MARIMKKYKPELNSIFQGWQKLSFGLDFQPQSSDPYQTDIEDFISAKAL